MFFLSNLKFHNSFIVNKIKQNVTHVILSKGCIAWWQRHWDVSMISWVQIWANHVYEFGTLGGL